MKSLKIGKVKFYLTDWNSDQTVGVNGIREQIRSFGILTKDKKNFLLISWGKGPYDIF